MASIADGFRLDNTHSTPIHVCQYLLQAARTKNNNLFVMAELFTSSSKLDAMFCQKLNLNGLVRELQQRGDTKATGDYFHWITCRQQVLGVVDETFIDIRDRPYKQLTNRTPEDIIYDCTHDNESVRDKFQTGRMALPHIGLASMADKCIATTWGYDQLVHKQIHCVEEKRLYPIMDQSSFIKDISGDNQRVQEPEPSQVKEVEPQPFQHEFRASFAHARSVAVAGSFNGWKPDIQMNKAGSQWTVNHTFPASFAGSKHEYKFVLNGGDW